MDEVYGPQSARLDAQAWEVGKLKAEVFRLQTALAAATERAKAAEKSHEMARNEIGQLEYVIGEAERQAEAVEKERDAAIARADALAARLAEVDDREHPA